jgi:tRNA pseudouridine38-40 synthase
MPNYKISIQYDGTDFFGWQSQPNNNTIQDKIQTAVQQITSENINLIASGRTDSGVHALGQVANFSLNESINEYKFLHSLNSILPMSISITDIELVDDNFHSRFDAKRRSYFYFIGKRKSPFFEKYSYSYPNIKKLDLNQLQMLSKVFLGKKDFTSFCKAKTDTENKVCEVYDIFWRDSKNFLIFKIEADRFLHGMVRTIVGTLLHCCVNSKDEKFINKILLDKNRNSAFESAPSKGLFLYKVKY